jgi:hypothetical protein
VARAKSRDWCELALRGNFEHALGKHDEYASRGLRASVPQLLMSTTAWASVPNVEDAASRAFPNGADSIRLEIRDLTRSARGAPPCQSRRMTVASSSGVPFVASSRACVSCCTASRGMTSDLRMARSLGNREELCTCCARGRRT